MWGKKLRSQRKEDKYFTINVLILAAKFYIHKCKFSNKKLDLCFSSKRLNNVSFISNSNNKKAVKTSMYELLDYLCVMYTTPLLFMSHSSVYYAGSQFPVFIAACGIFAGSTLDRVGLMIVFTIS